MQNIKKLVLLTFLATLVTVNAFATYRLVLQSGHEDLPVAVDWHERSSSVVSVGDDGRLIVTKPEDGRVLHRFRIGDDRVLGMSVNPSEDRAAIVTSGSGGFAVSVWDWGDEERIYSYETDAEPLFLSWSARGRYLTIGNLGSPSVIVLEGRTGRRLSYLQRLPSLYNDAYIGSTETIMMTYASTGSIRYWDIRSSALKLSAETVSNLNGITVLQTGSKSTIFAYRNETLYLINRQTGAVLDQIDVPGLADVSIDASTGELDVLTSNLVGASVLRYDAGNERFFPRGFGSGDLSMEASPESINPSLNPVKILRRSGTTYLLTNSGTLYGDSDGTFAPVIEDRIWRPDDLAFVNNSLLLSNGGEVQRFTSDFFASDSRGDIQDLNGLTREDRLVGTRAADTGLSVAADGGLVLWDKSQAAGDNGFRLFDFDGPGSRDAFVSVPGVLQKLEVLDDGRFMTVDRNGTVSLVDSRTGDVESRYAALGILDATFSSDGDFVLAGRSSAGLAGTPLESIDMTTRESIPVNDDRFMVYRCVTGPDGIYTIGVVRKSDGSSSTSLIRHEADNPERSRTVMDVTGEDLDARILPHPGGNGIYTTLGGTVRRIAGSRKTAFPWEEPVRSLAIRGKVLYGLDDDGALVMWNADNGRSLLKVYFFSEGDWIALPPDGDRIWASPGAIENVVLYRNGHAVDPRRVSAVTVRTDSSAM